MTIRQGPLLISELVLVHRVFQATGAGKVLAQVELVIGRLEGEPAAVREQVLAMTWPEFHAVAKQVIDVVNREMQTAVKAVAEWQMLDPTTSH